jgi:hypothetical protein
MSMQRLTVKQLIKELLDCDMDDEVHIELHTYKSGTAPRKSAVLFTFPLLSGWYV